MYYIVHVSSISVLCLLSKIVKFVKTTLSLTINVLANSIL